ncbi:MAG: anthranilate synthase component I [Pirellulales bacterium]
MSHLPDFETFRRLATGQHLVPVYRRVLSDALTPVSAFHLLDSGGAGMLFESVIGGERVGRYSFLSADPYVLLEARRNQVRVTRYVAGKPMVEEFASDDPIDELKRRVQAVRAAQIAELPPFVGGAVGYAGYDVVRYTEKKLVDAPTDDRDLPDLSFGFYDRMVIFDNVKKTLDVVVSARVEDETGKRVDLRAAYDAACAKVDATLKTLSQGTSDLPLDDVSTAGDALPNYVSNFQQSDFENAVRKCVEYIRAGDIFQVVISQRLEVEAKAPPFEIYRTLRVVNPSPFMFYLRTPDVTLVGSSPEVMVRVVDGRVTVRPLAGTRKRGKDEHEDRALAEELLADPKERAEHVMLVDLGRNDVGRVARFGSVELSDVMVIERYSHVMHITSNVEGDLAAGKDAFDALRACLPAGTVSGAPKVRAMQIIDEIEPHRRGPYAGAVGYVDHNGNMDTCIALRTLVVADGKAYVQAGAGIVADSDPTAEFEETLNKARGMLKAIAITEARVGGKDR